MNLIVLYGPPAVGKLTVAKILAAKIGYKLLHNHLLVNPIAEIFPFENPANRLLTREFRLRIIQEAIKSDIDMITTFGIAGNNPFSHITDIVDVVERNMAKLCLIQLTTNESTILQRVEDTSRKFHGKNLSREKLKEILKTNNNLFSTYDKKEHLTIDTTDIDPEKTSNIILEHFKL